MNQHEEMARVLEDRGLVWYTMDVGAASDLLDEWEDAQATIRELRQRLAPPASVSHYRPDDF